jgi:sulfate adenylyltransferase subunit 2
MNLVRFRALGWYPPSGAIESDATQEMLMPTNSERQGRLIDADSAGLMEKTKQEGQFWCVPPGVRHQ